MSQNPLSDHASYLRNKGRRRDEAAERERLLGVILRPEFAGLSSRTLAQRLGVPIGTVLDAREEGRVRILQSERSGRD